MPNKKYWSQVEKAMEFTNALGEAMGEENYGGKDKAEMQEIMSEIAERKANAQDGPMELITLSGLAKEFKEVHYTLVVHLVQSTTSVARSS